MYMVALKTALGALRPVSAPAGQSPQRYLYLYLAVYSLYIYMYAYTYIWSPSKRRLARCVPSHHRRDRAPNGIYI